MSIGVTSFVSGLQYVTPQYLSVLIVKRLSSVTISFLIPTQLMVGLENDIDGLMLDGQ
jgi:hypothetical protein